MYRTTTKSLALTLCIDTGRGYAKYGLANAGTPSVLQICQPNAECSQDTLYPSVLRRLGLRRSQLSEYSAIVSEPFVYASQLGARQRLTWRADVERRLLQGYGIRRLAIVDSASLCLFAHKLTSGVVINIGFGRTTIVPVLAGNIVRSAVRGLDLSGMELTQHMAELLHRAGHQLSWSPSWGGDRPLPPVTVARNLKELGAEVFPTSLRDHLGCSPFMLTSVLARTDSPVKECVLGSKTFALGWERFVCAEILFHDEGAGDGGANDPLHKGVMATIDAAIKAVADGEVEGVASSGDELKAELLKRVVLSGGSAGMPGLPERLAQELNEMVKPCHSPRASPRSPAPAVAKRAAAGESLPVVCGKVAVYPAHPSDTSTWLGASMLAGTSTFATHWAVRTPKNTGRAAGGRCGGDDSDDDEEEAEDSEGEEGSEDGEEGGDSDEEGDSEDSEYSEEGQGSSEYEQALSFDSEDDEEVTSESDEVGGSGAQSDEDNTDERAAPAAVDEAAGTRGEGASSGAGAGAPVGGE